MPLDFVSHYIVMTFLASTNKGGDCLEANNVDETLVVRSPMSPQTEDPRGSAPEHMEKQVSQDIDCNQHPSSGQCKVKGKREDDKDKFKHSKFHFSSISDLKNNGKSSDPTSDIGKVNDAAVLSLPLCENKVGDVGISSEVVPDSHTNELHGKEVEGSEGSFETPKGFSETKDGMDSAKNPSKSEALECQSKMLASVRKTSPTSSIMNCKSPSQDFKSEDTETANPFTKHGAKADHNIHIKNGSCTNDGARDEIPRKYVRERPRSSSKCSSHSSQSTQNSVPKQAIPDVRDSVHCSLSKPSLGHQTPSVVASSETNASMHHQKGLQAQNKTSSLVPQKAERLNQTNIHSSSKLNQSHTPSLNPSPTLNSSMLSDEEVWTGLLVFLLSSKNVSPIECRFFFLF